MTKESYITRLQRQVAEFKEHTKSVEELFHAEWYAKTKGYSNASMKKVKSAKSNERAKFKVIEPYLSE